MERRTGLGEVILPLCLGRQARAQQCSLASGQGQGVYLVCAPRVKAQRGPDSQHHRQAVEHHKGKGGVVNSTQVSI